MRKRTPSGASREKPARTGAPRPDLPAIATAPERFDVEDGRVYTRAPGELLHPAREPLSVIEEARRRSAASSSRRSTSSARCRNGQSRQMGLVPHAAHHRGRTGSWGASSASAATTCFWAASRAARFNIGADQFESYDTLPPPADGEEDTIQSWDIATTAGDGSDWSVCTTWAERGERYYLLDVLRARLVFPELKRRIYEQKAAFAAATVLVEDAGVGTGLIQQLRAEGIYVIARRPERSKVDRMATQSAMIEAGRVFLPRAAPWLDALRTELLAFPQGRHDDQVDSISQFLGRIGGRLRHDFF